MICSTEFNGRDYTVEIDKWRKTLWISQNSKRNMSQTRIFGKLSVKTKFQLKWAVRDAGIFVFIIIHQRRKKKRSQPSPGQTGQTQTWLLVVSAISSKGKTGYLFPLPALFLYLMSKPYGIYSVNITSCWLGLDGGFRWQLALHFKGSCPCVGDDWTAATSKKASLATCPLVPRACSGMS